MEFDDLHSFNLEFNAPIRNDYIWETVTQTPKYIFYWLARPCPKQTRLITSLVKSLLAQLTAAADVVERRCGRPLSKDRSGPYQILA